MKFVTTFCTIALLFNLGCGSGGPNDMPDIGKVSGTITLDGKPLPRAIILFSPTGGGRSSTATSGEDGTYSLMYKGDTPGAKIGEHEVTVSTYNAGDGDMDSPNFKPAREEEVPEKYRGPSELKVMVEAGENDIPLTLTN